ncbi:hypothetical protein [Actinomadura madurae]|uniref:hypothetical protein n=1 Tax=Actinomadura madurae TaxID=1993 RepID=UPI0020264C58|nr:hypothetical protein [Actinomadura madurae]MCP9952295.1 hypothetical protein [Actinomadura madurae]MCP9969064.1 hypothetical protein [Actinomadura madurae]MCP9981535.1 hypothetical protein [Actinomadura madurae]MCQ0006954.1 hypothetical protein [Actinomadura madurae]MCQ0017735.1 hypothetical protein [Actinomadura madurae]
MSNTPNFTSMTAADLAEILFTSRLQESDHPSAEQVRIAIHDRFGACGEDRTACVAAVAQEAGDHPETYVARMRWALTTVSAAYPELATAA